ncbi:Hemicentin-1 [Aphelenchoides fujianensis]|nr:Hemicentin-1 [Aphelenchoides fujianensis]
MFASKWLLVLLLLLPFVLNVQTENEQEVAADDSEFLEEITNLPQAETTDEATEEREGVDFLSLVAHDRKPRACPRVAVIPSPEWRFGEWSLWSQCSASCGPRGIRHRRRQCAASNPNCQTSESESCNLRACAPGWSEWCEWEACRVTCGTGERQRVRFCEGGTLRCPGKDFQVSRCNAGVPCPGYHEWSSWTTCSVSCGLGTQRRERQCFDEALCRGNRTEERRCNEGPCNRYGRGQWTPWSSWSACDRQCDGGLSTRRRNCHPRREFCRGEESEWTTWAPWSGCHAPQGHDCRQGAPPTGVRARQRYCVGRSRQEQCDWTCGGGSAASQERENCRLDPRNDPCRGRSG